MTATYTEPLTIEQAVAAVKHHYSELERLQNVRDDYEEAMAQDLHALYDRYAESPTIDLHKAAKQYCQHREARNQAVIDRYDLRQSKPEAPSHAEGYPVIYWAAGDVLCSECIHDWPEDLDGGVIYFEGPAETCQGCQKQLESAYGDPNEPEPDPLTDAYNSAQATADALDVPVILTRPDGQITVWPTREEDTDEYMPDGDPLTEEPDHASLYEQRHDEQTAAALAIYEETGRLPRSL